MECKPLKGHFHILESQSFSSPKCWNLSFRLPFPKFAALAWSSFRSVPKMSGEVMANCLDATVKKNLQSHKLEKNSQWAVISLRDQTWTQQSGFAMNIFQEFRKSSMAIWSRLDYVEAKSDFFLKKQKPDAHSWIVDQHPSWQLSSGINWYWWCHGMIGRGGPVACTVHTLHED